jgi:hypothetical protein
MFSLIPRAANIENVILYYRIITMFFQESLTPELTLNTLYVFIVLLVIITSTQAINLPGRAANGQIATKALIAVLGFTTLKLLPVLIILNESRHYFSGINPKLSGP